MTFVPHYTLWPNPLLILKASDYIYNPKWQHQQLGYIIEYRCLDINSIVKGSHYQSVLQ